MIANKINFFFQTFADSNLYNAEILPLLFSRFISFKLNSTNLNNSSVVCNNFFFEN